MKLKITIALLVGMVIGAVSYRTWDTHTATARHWRAVHEYVAYMREPLNYKPTGDGHTIAQAPLDPDPHLAALVSAGELLHDDLILPSITYPNPAVHEHWKAFCQAHPDEIVFSYGGAEPGPIHLEFWFTESGRPLIDQLTEELKTLGRQ